MSRIALLLGQPQERRQVAALLSSHHELLAGEATEVLAQPFDLCIVGLGELDRFRARLERRKAAEQPRFLPVLAVTERRELEPCARELSRGIDEVIVSPVEPEELEARVAGLLRMRNLSQRLEHGAVAHESGSRDAEMEAVFRVLPEALVLHDRSGAVVRLNPAAERLVRHLPPPAGAAAAPAGSTRVETADGRPLGREELPAARALRGETLYGETLLIRRAGEPPIWVSASAAPVCTDEGVTGAVASYLDLTQVRELEAQREDLLRAISHDLRTPLAVIHLQAQLLKEVLERSDQADRSLVRSLESLLGSARRMNSMIEDLVDLARQQGGQLKLERRPVDLRAFVADVLQRAEPLVRTRHGTVAIAEGLDRVSADVNRLERILLNLLANAVKHSPPEADVLVRAESLGQEVMIAVADAAAAEPEEQLSHAFARLCRDAQAVRRIEDLGMGLYITRMLIEAHGGRLWAEGAVGKGSTFYFTLPVYEPARPSR